MLTNYWSISKIAEIAETIPSRLRPSVPRPRLKPQNSGLERPQDRDMWYQVQDCSLMDYTFGRWLGLRKGIRHVKSKLQMFALGRTILIRVIQDSLAR